MKKNKLYYFIWVFILFFCSVGNQVSFASPRKLSDYHLINGINQEGDLDLNSFFTVEQLAVLLVKINQLDFPENSENALSYFSDTTKISGWAKPFLSACVLNHFFDAEPGETDAKGTVGGKLLSGVMLKSLGYKNLTEYQTESLLRLYDIQLEDKAILRKDAFDYIWNVITKPICYDGGTLVEKKGIVHPNEMPRISNRESFYGNGFSYTAESTPLLPHMTIMHAGGRIHGFTYANTVDAILHHYRRGKKLFEIDFLRTSDGVYWGLHDWKRIHSPLFEQEEEEGRKYTNFPLDSQTLKNIKFSHGMCHIDLDVLRDLIREYPDIVIITDVKDDNMDFLRFVLSDYPDLVQNMIPQVYSRREYEEAESLGFQNIIYTLYRSKDTPSELLDFLKHAKPHAITVPWERFLNPGWRALLEEDVKIYTHTVNSLGHWEWLFSMGVDGVFTDDL